MSLKENVKAIKEELSTEEQFLESVIKAESFWKKYKMLIIVALVVLFVGLIAKAIVDYTKEQNRLNANIAYNQLLSDEHDAAALATLKEKSPKLYEMYLFKKNMALNDMATFEKSSSEISDPVLKDLLSYHMASLQKKVRASDVTVAKDFALLQEGYLLLQENKIKEAGAKFDQISPNSSLRATVSILNHYMGK